MLARAGAKVTAYDRLDLSDPRLKLPEPVRE